MQDNPKKALVFSFTYFPFIGGAEVALKEITKRIPHIQFDIVTARLDKESPREETVGNTNIYRVGRGSKLDKIFYPIHAFLFSQKLHKKNKYNLVWAMMATWAGIAALLFKLFNKKVKYLLTLQSGDSDFFIWLRTWFWYPFYRMVYTKADHIQVISNWLGQRARKYGYKGDVSVIPNGVDLDKIKNIDNKIQIDIPKDNKVILTVSRLVKKNDVESLIRSVHLLITKHKLPVSLIIAGPGKLENKLKKLVKDLKIDQQVIFLGNVPHQQVLKYYSIADVFVRPSLSEGLGVSFIEAMAAGLPIIAPPVGGIPDFLKDKETGLFCKVKDPSNLAEKVKTLLEDSHLHQKLQASGIKLVKERYDWDIIGESMYKIINRLA